MACAVPCVVTDVGDSARIVGDTGKVVPPRDSRALAEAWSELLAAGEPERRALGLAARGRIEALYSLPAIVDQYEALYRSVAVRAAGEGLIDPTS
jgi:glycosyltransferase involved in cell wall biosynthesis